MAQRSRIAHSKSPFLATVTAVTVTACGGTLTGEGLGLLSGNGEQPGGTSVNPSQPVCPESPPEYGSACEAAAPLECEWGDCRSAARHRRPHKAGEGGQAAAFRPAPKPSQRPPAYQPRPAGEWQGMPVDLNLRVPCSEPEGVCSLALACREDGRCGPCTQDSHCWAGERCVLDRCLAREQVECSKTADCPEEHRCVLSGFGGGERHNVGMRAFCLDEKGGRPQEGAPYPPAAFEGPSSTASLLQSRLRELMKKDIQ